VRQKKDEKRKRKKEGYYRILGSVASPSLSTHGGTRQDTFQGHTGSPTKPHRPRVYDNDGAHSLPRARGPHVPRTRGRIRGDLCSILRAGIQCTIASVPPLAVASLGPRAAQPVSLGGPAHRALHDFV
jgi:hypothetical protein